MERIDELVKIRGGKKQSFTKKISAIEKKLLRESPSPAAVSYFIEEVEEKIKDVELANAECIRVDELNKQNHENWFTEVQAMGAALISRLREEMTSRFEEHEEFVKMRAGKEQSFKKKISMIENSLESECPSPTKISYFIEELQDKIKDMELVNREC